MKGDTQTAEGQELSAELHEVHQGDNNVTAHIKVLEDGEWIGDFFAEFTFRTVGGGERAYVADWDSIKLGNGLYVDEQPPFWPVEEAAELLEDRYALQNFEAWNTGRNDL